MKRTTMVAVLASIAMFGSGLAVGRAVAPKTAKRQAVPTSGSTTSPTPTEPAVVRRTVSIRTEVTTDEAKIKVFSWARSSHSLQYQAPNTHIRVYHIELSWCASTQPSGSDSYTVPPRFTMITADNAEYESQILNDTYGVRIAGSLPLRMSLTPGECAQGLVFFLGPRDQAATDIVFTSSSAIIRWTVT